MRRSWALRAACALAALAACEGRPGSAPPPGSLSLILPRVEEEAARGLPLEGARLLASKLDDLPAAEKGEAQAVLARLYSRGNANERCLEAAREARAAGINRPEVLYLEGEARRQLHLPGALETLEQALAAAPEHPPTLLAIARLRFRSSEPRSALPLFEKYFRLAKPGDSERWTALLEHGRALRETGQHQEAADLFVTCLEERPLESILYSELASTLYRMRLRREARFVEEIYRLISQSSFEDQTEERLLQSGATAFALGQRAINATRERRFLEAFRSYRQALALDATDPRLRSFQADLCLHFRRFAEARAVLDGALAARLEPSSGLHWMKGRVHLEEKDYRGALEAFRASLEALRREGDAGGQDKGQAPLFSVLLAMARSGVESGVLDAAEEAVAAAEKLVPGGWEPPFWRARALLARGDAGAALSSFDEAARRSGQAISDIRHWRAVALESLGRRAEALEELEKVVQAQPGFTPAYPVLERLAVGDPSRAALWSQAAGEIAALEARRNEIAASFRAKPLEETGPELLEMGKLLRRLKSPDHADFLFLAADLLTSNAEAHRLIVQGLKGSQDVFLRLRYLKKLLHLDSGDEQVPAAIAEIYSKLHVHLDEAERLAARSHEIKPSAASWRLLAEAAIRKGDVEKGKALLRDGLAAFPGDKGLAEALARAEAPPGSSP